MFLEVELSVARWFLVAIPCPRASGVRSSESGARLDVDPVWAMSFRLVRGLFRVATFSLVSCFELVMCCVRGLAGERFVAWSRLARDESERRGGWPLSSSRLFEGVSVW